MNKGLAAIHLAAVLGSVLALTGAPSAEEVEQTFEVEEDVRIDLEILTGSIRVKGTDEALVKIRSDGDIEIKGSRRRIRVRAPATRGFPWFRGIGVDLEVEVPRNSRIHAKTIDGPIEVDGVEGEVRLHAANGQLEVKGGPREANLETLNSSIKFEGKDSEVVAKTLNGQIELLGVAGDVEASTVSGQIKVVGDHLERVELRTMSGQIELDASLSEHARVFAKTYSGQVRLLLPEGTSARFEIESYSGGVHSDFAAQLEDEEDGGGFGEGRRGELSFRVGDGDSRISIESFSGGVRIERSNR